MELTSKILVLDMNENRFTASAAVLQEKGAVFEGSLKSLWEMAKGHQDSALTKPKDVSDGVAVSYVRVVDYQGMHYELERDPKDKNDLNLLTSPRLVVVSDRRPEERFGLAWIEALKRGSAGNNMPPMLPLYGYLAADNNQIGANPHIAQLRAALAHPAFVSAAKTAIVYGVEKMPAPHS